MSLLEIQRHEGWAGIPSWILKSRLLLIKRGVPVSWSALHLEMAPSVTWWESSSVDWNLRCWNPNAASQSMISFRRQLGRTDISLAFASTIYSWLSIYMVSTLYSSKSRRSRPHRSHLNHCSKGTRNMILRTVMTECKATCINRYNPPSKKEKT